MNHIDKNYTSAIDHELEVFNKNNPPSQAQIDEQLKYKKINDLRDNIQLNSINKKEEIWNDF